MMKISTRKILIFLPIIILLLCALFWRPIVTWGLEKYLRHVARNVLDSDLIADTMYIENGSLIVVNPQLIGRKPVAEGGLALEADQLSFHLNTALRQGYVDLDVALHKPRVNLRQSSSEIQSRLIDSLALSTVVKVNSTLKITEGMVTFHDFATDPPAPQTFYFQFDGQCQDVAKGCLVASLDDPHLKDNCIVLSIEQTPERLLAVDFDFNAVQCPSLFQALASFVPSLENLQVSSGTVMGKMAVSIPREGRTFAVGTLTLADVAYAQSELEMRGYIKEAKLQLSENETASTTSTPQTTPRTIGHLELAKGCQLAFARNGQPLCEIVDFGGSMYFQTQDGARIAFEGNYVHDGQTSALQVGGVARYANEGEASLDLQLKLSGDGREEATARFVTRQLSTKFKFAEIALKNIGPSEFDIVSAFVAPHCPEFRDVHMASGRIDATVLAYLKGLRLTDLKIEKIAAQDLEFHFASWDLAVHVQELSGDLAVNLATEKALDTLNAELVIANGHVQFIEGELAPCQFSDLQTRLTVKRGVIHKSIVSGEFAGLRGTVDLDGLSPDGEIIKLYFTGGAMGLANWMPEKLRRGMQASFMQDELILAAGIRKAAKGMTVEGTLQIKGALERHGPTFEFGFDVEKSSRQLWGRWPAHHLAWEFWHQIGLETRQSSMPAIAAPIALLEAKWMRRELGIGGFVIRDGWFQAQNLPLEKYVVPFVFPDNGPKLTGMGDFQGTFDHESLALNYELHHFTMESPHFIFEMPPTEAKNAEDPLTRLPGVHYFDFMAETSYGSLPLKNASYFYKGSGLLFSDINAVLAFAGPKSHFNNLTTTCSGIYFGGKIDLDLTKQDKGSFDADVYVHTVKGKFSQVQQLFSHFEKLQYFQKYPLEGNLAVREPGMEMHMHFRPNQFFMESKVHGTLTEGVILQPADIKVKAKEICFNFDFDQAAKTFDLTDIRGALSIGKGDPIDEFVLAGDHIRFTNLDRREAIFDVWVGDHNRDIIRLAGHTKTDPQDISAEAIEFVFDQHLTHFGNVHPERVELCLKNWTQVQSFQLDFNLGLATLFNDLLSLSRTGIFSLPTALQEEIDALKSPGGQFKIGFHYDDQTSAFGYHAAGEDVKVGTYQFKKFLLQGMKKNDTWAIEQLVFDDISLAADLVKISHGWKVDFLGLRIGHSLLMGLEGDYRSGEAGFDGKVNLLEVNLSKLAEWPALTAFVEAFQPKGDVRATGQIHLEVDKSLPRGWRADVLLNAACKGCELKGLAFQDSANASVHFDTDRGLSVRHLKTALKDGPQGDLLGLLDFEKIEYLMTNAEMHLDSMQFNIPAENIKKVTALLKANFSDAINDGMIATFNALKRSSNLEGAFSLTNTAETFAVQLSLKDGFYYFRGQDHDISNFVLKYDLKELKAIMQYRFSQHLFWLEVISRGPAFDSGLMILADHHPEHLQSAEKLPLRVEWMQHPLFGFQIKKAVGHFAGLDVNLTTDPEMHLNNETLHLVGQMNVKPQVAAALVSAELQAKVKAWQLGEGYSLNGNWRLDKIVSADESGQLHFHGLLEGHNFVLKGYQFQSLNAWVDYVPRSLSFRQMRIEDPAGVMQIAQVDLFRDAQGGWQLNIPQIVVNNLRPSLLQEAGMPPVTVGKALLVRQLEIQNLVGHCSDLTTLRGAGKLLFINPPKKNLQNTIFAIPAEILTMIGLDLTVLNPISGTILFDIRDGKSYLTKFKDVYSEGKLSKFHLSNVSPSYLDFDGNLNVQIRMKQYNLFFKLAELFTVNIRGTLLNPDYSLQRHRSNREPTGKSEATRKSEVGSRNSEA